MLQRKLVKQPQQAIDMLGPPCYTQDKQTRLGDGEHKITGPDDNLMKRMSRTTAYAAGNDLDMQWIRLNKSCQFLSHTIHTQRILS